MARQGSDCQARVQRVKSFAEAASAELLSIRLLAEFTEAALPRTEHDRTIVSSLVHVASIDLLRVRRFRERPHTPPTVLSAVKSSPADRSPGVSWNLLVTTV